MSRLQEYEILPRRRQARSVVLNENNEVLLIKHIDATPASDSDPVLEYWVVPGGKLETGENARQAAERETGEETGVSGLSHIGHFCTVEKALRYGDQMMLMVAEYELFRVAGKPDLTLPDNGEPIFDARWWSLEEIRRSMEAFRPEAFFETLLIISDKI